MTLNRALSAFRPGLGAGTAPVKPQTSDADLFLARLEQVLGSEIRSTEKSRLPQPYLPQPSSARPTEAATPDRVVHTVTAQTLAAWPFVTEEPAPAPQSSPKPVPARKTARKPAASQPGNALYAASDLKPDENQLPSPAVTRPFPPQPVPVAEPELARYVSQSGLFFDSWDSQRRNSGSHQTAPEQQQAQKLYEYPAVLIPSK